MVRRALPAVHEIMGQHEGQQILIVTHGLLLASIVAALVGVVTMPACWGSRKTPATRR